MSILLKQFVLSCKTKSKCLLEMPWLFHDLAIENSVAMNILLSSVMLSRSVIFNSCNTLDCNRPGSSVYEIFQARILEWVAVSFSRGSSRARDWTCVSWTGRWILCYQATWEASALTCFCAICLWCRDFILHHIFHIHIHQDPVKISLLFWLYWKKIALSHFPSEVVGVWASL